MKRCRLLLGLCLLAPLSVRAQSAPVPAPTPAAAPDPLHAQLDRIYNQAAFKEKKFGPFQWLEGGKAYTTVEASASAGGGQGHRPLRLGDGRAARPRVGREPRSRCGRNAARPRDVLLVRGRPQAPDFHEHAEGLAAEHARRLLGPRHRERQAPEARRRQAGGEPHVRQVLARRHARRLCPGQRPLGRGALAAGRSRA